MTSSQQPSEASEVPPRDQYVGGIKNEIVQLRAYFKRQITIYRVAQSTVILSAASVTVLAATAAVPRWILALFGALAAVIEGIQGLYQFRGSALNAMKGANSLERSLNKYMTAVEPYEGSTAQAFPELVGQVEAIRESTDSAFLQTWSAGTRQHGVEK